VTRGILAKMVPVGLLLVAGCAGPGKPAYSPAEVKACAAEQARYFDAVIAACYDRYSFEACPDVPALKAEHKTRQEAAGCR